MAESITNPTEPIGASPSSSPATVSESRKEKRKILKKEKRKQLRKELAEKARLAEEARLNDPEEQRRIQLEEERERERIERERKEFEEREKLFLEALARKRAEEEEEEERRTLEEEELKKNQEGQDEPNEDDDWEYVEEGPPEIIWQGNEIIVKKNRVKVKKKDLGPHIREADADRPTSNPLPPQSEAFADHQNAPPISAQQLLENVAQQVPNFGTEQDKAHCPFHIKTGACRFGSRCSRVHFYPDRSCTLLMKNMYNGPGLAWEQDEGLENSLHKSLQWRFKPVACMGRCNDTTYSYTDEEVERYYEEFYEDVHTDFLKYGEIVNFKVCRNGAFHLRGNLYVHYKSLDSAVMAYHAMNGRYFAGKQVKCEFVSVTRWKIAICGEYMKSRLKTCSRGTACNFIHCFRNPGGDYEWADWDKPPPRFWVEKMNALFGHSDETRYGQRMEEIFSKKPNKSSEQLPADKDRYHSRRSRSRDKYSRNGRSSSHTDHEKSRDRRILDSRDGCKRQRTPEEKIHKETNLRRHHHRYGRTSDTDSAGDYSEAERNAEVFHDRNRKSSRSHHSEVKEYSEASRNRRHETDSDGNLSDCDTGIGRQQHRKENRIFRTSKQNECHYAKLTDYKHKDGSSSRTEVYLSGGDVSDNDGTKSRHQGHKMKSSSHLEEISEVLRDYNENRSESHVTDNGERSDEDRGHYRRRKNSKSRKKASEIQDYTRYRKIKTHATDSCALMEEERYRPEETFEERYRPQD